MVAKACFVGAFASLMLLIMVDNTEGFSVGQLGKLQGATRASARLGSRACQRSPLQLQMAVGTSSKIGKAVKKPTGAMTVSIQVCSSAKGLTKLDLEALSQTLRKCKSATIFAHVDVLDTIIKEQATAKGNFPGPCPVVSYGSTDVQAAIASGASGIVLPLKNLGLDSASELSKQAESKIDAVWEVTSTEEAKAAAAAGAKLIVARSVAEDEAKAFMDALPKDCVAIAAVGAMQAEAGEVQEAKSLKASGFHSILVEDACVGDAEDIQFSRWAIEEMSSKASQEFKITGMTGHVNGHYGTGTFERSQAATVWKRKQQV